jgi:hypothetical protein
MGTQYEIHNRAKLCEAEYCVPKTFTRKYTYISEEI